MDTRIDMVGYSGGEDRSSTGPASREEGKVMAANPNHTPPRSIRVPDELWDAAKDVATDKGETVSDAINKFLARYVKQGVKQETPLERQLRQRGA